MVEPPFRRQTNGLPPWHLVANPTFSRWFGRKNVAPKKNRPVWRGFLLRCVHFPVGLENLFMIVYECQGWRCPNRWVQKNTTWLLSRNPRFYNYVDWKGGTLLTWQGFRILHSCLWWSHWSYLPTLHRSNLLPIIMEVESSLLGD